MISLSDKWIDGKQVEESLEELSRSEAPLTDLQRDYQDFLQSIAEAVEDRDLTLRDVRLLSLPYFYDEWVQDMVLSHGRGVLLEEWVRDTLDWDFLSHFLKTMCVDVRVSGEWFLVWTGDLFVDPPV